MERAPYNPPDGYAATLPFKAGTIFLKESYRKKRHIKRGCFQPLCVLFYYSVVLILTEFDCFIYLVTNI